MTARKSGQIGRKRGRQFGEYSPAVSAPGFGVVTDYREHGGGHWVIAKLAHRQDLPRHRILGRENRSSR